MIKLFDETLIVGPLLKDESKKLGKEIKIEDVDELKELIGCEIEIVKFER